MLIVNISVLCLSTRSFSKHHTITYVDLSRSTSKSSVQFQFCPIQAKLKETSLKQKSSDEKLLILVVQSENQESEIGHFRVPFTSVSKRVQVRNLSYENGFTSNANQTYFHMKAFALGLVLTQRQEATWK